MKQLLQSKRKSKFLSLLAGCILTVGVLCGYSYRSLPKNWATGSTGSAKYLDGSTLLLSFFIEDPESSWTEEEKGIVMSKMNIANDFLVSEGASYGKSVELIYDIYEHPDLAYTISYSEVIDDSDDAAFELLDFITEYINDNISTRKILSSYGVDSIGYMCFLNKDGVSYTFPYYEGDSDIYYYETCYMFLKCDDDYEPPSVYAHEMLHLFGARDLYSPNKIDGITNDFVNHIETNYSNEIMLTTYDENWNNVQEYVSNDLTDITAYFIGWVDTIPELETYPTIRYPAPASFGETEYAKESDDYTDSHWGAKTEETTDIGTGSHWGSGSSGGGSWGSGSWGSGSNDVSTHPEDNGTEPSPPADMDLGFWDYVQFILWYLFQS